MRALPLVVLALACGPAPRTPDGQDLSADGLKAMATSRSFKDWPAEANVHPSEGPHGPKVRVWFNELLRASLKAGNTTHPNGSITVKELYGEDGKTITGHAIDAKDSTGAWVFYEAFPPSYAKPFYFVGTDNFCATCHQSGVDQYRGKLSNVP